MEQQTKLSDLTVTLENIQVLQGIVLPATKLLSSMPQAERVLYAPYLIGGKDSIVKLSILSYKNLYTQEVIRALIASGRELCEEYLKMTKKLMLRDTSNLHEFKKQVIESNDEQLIRLLLGYYDLNPWEEADLLSVRCCSANRKGKEDTLIQDYFSKNRIGSPAKNLLCRPEYAYYWYLYQQQVKIGCWDKMKYGIRRSWNGFRYRFGL